MSLSPSELILHPDGSVFHLALTPDQVADLVFLVGDPGRVEKVSQHFDSIECRVEKREFHTHTGRIGNRRITVISTGIGTDNIDIVLHELDILKNVDLQTREVRPTIRQIDLIRLGTSGALQDDLTPGSVVRTRIALGLDPLLHFYDAKTLMDQDLLESLHVFADAHFKLPVNPYAFGGDDRLFEAFGSVFPQSGITITLPGFYGPQGRVIRLPLHDDTMWHHLARFRYHDLRITNLEMESSGIYGLSRLFGHSALSINLILANRARKTFLPDPAKAMQSMIEEVLSNLPAPRTT
ncbi:MAG: nucleoside phosphorylase [Saprospiraceae bacterium]|nr:nucleoside phosphorylase [Saprospiraceae bacterium]